MTKLTQTMIEGASAIGRQLLSAADDAAARVLLGIPADIPVITPWAAYTPVFQGFGTPDQVSLFQRRVGDTLYIRGRFRSQTPTAVEARLSCGTSGSPLVIDTAKNTTGFKSGSWSSDDVSLPSGQVIAFGGVNYVSFSAPGTPALAQNGNAILVTGKTMFVEVAVPIVGW
ncbi:hypothetical protein [Rhizobium leguminosarum]|uniref:hypothetical protein n=1 Tax=Rhizobium leguminosarum TaxID=384 RepID=UPI000481BC60|nr:hypothetical protein [Rhizobium leguminosarum]